MTVFRLAAALALLTAPLVAPLNAQSRPAAEPPVVRVRMETGAGAFVVSLDTRRAPATTRNFLAYVDDGRLNGADIYRVARAARAPGIGFVQGGIRSDATRILPPFPLETTKQTGLRHVDGTISMARRDGPGVGGWKLLHHRWA